MVSASVPRGPWGSSYLDGLKNSSRRPVSSRQEPEGLSSRACPVQPGDAGAQRSETVWPTCSPQCPPTLSPPVSRRKLNSPGNGPDPRILDGTLKKTGRTSFTAKAAIQRLPGGGSKVSLTRGELIQVQIHGKELHGIKPKPLIKLTLVPLPSSRTAQNKPCPCTGQSLGRVEAVIVGS